MSPPLVRIPSSRPDTKSYHACSRDPPRAPAPSVCRPVRCRQTWSPTLFRTPRGLVVGEYGCRDRRSRGIVSNTLWRSQGVCDCLLANLARRPAGISSGRSGMALDDGAFPVCLLCPLVDTRFPYKVKFGRQPQIPPNGAWSRSIVWRARWLDPLRIARPSEDALL